MRKITFCGHSKVNNQKEIEKALLQEILKYGNDEPLIFYLGGYGDFDRIAKICALNYKKIHTKSLIVFVTPYIEESYLKYRDPIFCGYDEILYPNLEDVPKKFAIIERNKEMVNISDFVICYVNRDYGGAVKTFNYIKKIKKLYINLA